MNWGMRISWPPDWDFAQRYLYYRRVLAHLTTCGLKYRDHRPGRLGFLDQEYLVTGADTGMLLFELSWTSVPDVLIKFREWHG